MEESMTTYDKAPDTVSEVRTSHVRPDGVKRRNLHRRDVGKRPEGGRIWCGLDRVYGQLSQAWCYWTRSCKQQRSCTARQSAFAARELKTWGTMQHADTLRAGCLLYDTC